MQDMRIGVVQMICRVGPTEANLETIERFSEKASGQDVDMLCFPELSICGYNAGSTAHPEPETLDGPSVGRLKAIAAGNGITLLAGLLERDRSGIVYNTQVICDADGLVGAYRKTHVPTAEIGTWSAGAELPVFLHNKARYGIEICYDSHFPEVSAILAKNGADILFFPMLRPAPVGARLGRQPRLRKLAGCAICQLVPMTIRSTWLCAIRPATTTRIGVLRGCPLFVTRTG